MADRLRVRSTSKRSDQTMKPLQNGTFWSIDQDSGFEGPRVRVKITEKQIHIEKFLLLGPSFYIDVL